MQRNPGAVLSVNVVRRKQNVRNCGARECAFSLQWFQDEQRWNNVANDPDFDSLRHLAETSPQAYFAERTRLIEEFLCSVPPERARALRDFQAQIDAVRASAGTPAKATDSLMGMLSDHLQALLGNTANLAVEAAQLRSALHLPPSGGDARPSGSIRPN